LATKRKTITKDDFVKANNGGLVSTGGCIIQVLSGALLVGTTSTNTNEPNDEDCYQLNDNFVYSGSDDVYIKAQAHDAIIVIDKV
jgi:hypothetical protein